MKTSNYKLHNIIFILTSFFDEKKYIWTLSNDIYLATQYGYLSNICYVALYLVNI